MTIKTRVLALAAAAALAASTIAHDASAFCGFYVSGATGELYNNATQVVLMREGTRTVLSMANNYKGPPENFAMVIPVPVILQKENVKTLPRDIFKKVDQLAAPRLVEYWEQDPCYIPPPVAVAAVLAPSPGGVAEGAIDRGVKIEAQFSVGEYDVVILSAKDSTGLDAWLKQEKYSIPAGAEPVLKPYVQAGMKFFVARVNIDKVAKDGEKTMLSPLRFHYDSERFELPVRLGLLNSSGKQDLLIHILAKGKRYEVANYPNVTIPTNLDVGEITKEQFSTFYAALFDQTLEKNPKAVVTEYAWDAGSCDPCPGPTLDPSDLATLGNDAMPSPGAWGHVLTRLHARYGKESLGEDLVFKEAPPIAGGREVRMDGKTLERGATTGAGVNNFQGRYAIRHPWKGEVSCKEPHRGRWGGPPGTEINPWSPPAPPAAVKEVAFAPRGKTPLTSFLVGDQNELGVKGSAPVPSPVQPRGKGDSSGSASPASTSAPAPSKGCASGCAVPSGAGGGSAAAAAAALALLVGRRQRRRSARTGSQS